MTQYTESRKHRTHDNRLAALYGTACSMAFAATVAVVLRVMCRRRLKQALSSDDYTILFALVGVVLNSVFYALSLTSRVIAVLGTLS